MMPLEAKQAPPSLSCRSVAQPAVELSREGVLTPTVAIPSLVSRTLPLTCPPTHPHPHATVRPREQPIRPHLDAVPVNHTQHVASERMLRMLVEECSKGEDSVIWVDPEGSMVVQADVDPQ